MKVDRKALKAMSKMVKCKNPHLKGEDFKNEVKAVYTEFLNYTMRKIMDLLSDSEKQNIKDFIEQENFEKVREVVVDFIRRESKYMTGIELDFEKIYLKDD